MVNVKIIVAQHRKPKNSQNWSTRLCYFLVYLFSCGLINTKPVNWKIGILEYDNHCPDFNLVLRHKVNQVVRHFAYYWVHTPKWDGRLFLLVVYLHFSIYLLPADSKSDYVNLYLTKYTLHEICASHWLESCATKFERPKFLQFINWKKGMSEIVSVL